MRVISGLAKGRKLKTSKNNAIRPTTDKIKESLFNIILAKVNEAYVLDLYAGSGALGIEALSRGAQEAYFVDSSGESVKIIKDNLSHVRLEDKAEVYNYKVFSSIKYFSKIGKKFDIIFLDPPYDKYTSKDLQAIIDNDILKEDGIIILECGTSTKNIKNIDERLICVDERIYGGTKILLYKFS